MLKYSNQTVFVKVTGSFQTEVNFFLLEDAMVVPLVFGLGPSPCEHVSNTSRAFQYTHADDVTGIPICLVGE